jgi:hypothetical protein
MTEGVAPNKSQTAKIAPRSFCFVLFVLTTPSMPVVAGSIQGPQLPHPAGVGNFAYFCSGVLGEAQRSEAAPQGRWRFQPLWQPANHTPGAK